ncbi:PREDICTED: DNAJ protein JJJ1 homolog [Camelina sativa]|uniref:DNAJ protein JJJ1 homolog n=1 Tax=Camelina sativa TaxID=90675 RepID=A0ABM0SUD6_CAMSA|nr:PREDICTED: DNAJ protein JJJ1 homolog [Camelina sativa]
MASSSSRSEKRCHYEVLGISKESSPDEIRSAYRRLALQRHPDKLMKAGGLSEAEATAQFQELVHAYEVLSDPKERAWYDSHRSQILFADHGSAGGSKSGGMPGGSVPDLFAFFSTTVYSGYSDTGKGFYKVFYDVFNSVYLNEIKFARTLGLRMDSVREAPIMGNLESPYAQVTAFYNYWLGFCTVMDFCWVDQYDVVAGPNRKSRRLMEEENKKLRKKAKREYNDTVRGLAEFVKKRDKRVIDMMVKKKEEERERKKKMEKERLERAMNYEEPDWAKAHEGEEEGAGFNVLEEDDDDAERKNEQLYCIVCSKKFKSEKQWKNHEQSKKHKEKVAELRESLTDYEEETEEEEIDETLDPPESVDQLHEKFQEGFNIDGEDEDVKEEVSGEADETDDEYFGAEEDMKGSSESEDEDVDDEMSLLKKMVSGQKNKRKNSVSMEEDEVEVEIERDTADFSEFDNQKSTGRNKEAKEERSKHDAGKEMADDTIKVQIPEDDDDPDENVNATDSASRAFEDSQKDEADSMQYDNRKSTGRRRRSKKGKDKNNLGGSTEKSSEADDNTPYVNRDMETQDYKKVPRSKKSTRGMKSKGTTKKNSNNECDRCGEEFESRTKLHKHLADSGHATVKSR